ncbi:MAG: pyrroline-5-carboxylate reductase [Nitrospirota bacterium]|nr:pyrroline-5-carboxylate reductase [Nitrospirota bacterium]
MSIGKSIAFIGGGNMAEALVKGCLRAGLFEPAQITVADASADRLAYIGTQYGVKTTSDNGEACRSAAILVLSVKPQVMPHVLAEAKGSVGHKPLVVSVAAGVPIATIAAEFGQDARIIRAMPNTPALILEGAAAVAKGGGATAEDLSIAVKIFEAVGIAVVVDEKLMDAVTGLSGSGPAYIFTVIDALADGGVKMGLPRETALKLVAQTTLGAAKLILETGKHPGVLKEGVTSPGGTTIAGLHRLEDGGVRSALMGAVEAATLRSKELGKKEG